MAPDVGVGKHHAYAAQWFVMALDHPGTACRFQLIRPAEQPDSGPLVQFSIHSLPDPSRSQAQRTRRGRLKMLAVWAVCAAPSGGLVLHLLRHAPTRQGQLWAIDPASHQHAGRCFLVAARFARQCGAAIVTQGQWLLVTVAGGACDKACEEHLYQQRQLRETLGKDKDPRMDRVWLVTDDAPVRRELMPALQQAWVLRASDEAVRRWLFPQAGQGLNQHLYTVDPWGDWMMRFPAQGRPSRVKRPGSADESQCVLG